MSGDLAGFTIGITADRRADEQADLLRRRGAEVRHAAVMTCRRLLSADDLARTTSLVLDDPPDVFIANTAIGIRAWLAAAEAVGIERALREVLADTVVLARGPKSAVALRQLGIEPSTIAPTERLAAVSEFAMAIAPPGAHVVLQLDGGGEGPELDRLRANGYRVTTIGTYEWAPPDDPDAVVRLLHQATEGAVDALTFTCSPAVQHLVALADAHGLGDALRDPRNGIVMACVGPVTADAALAAGLPSIVFPNPGRIGLMIRTLADALALVSRVERAS